MHRSTRRHGVVDLLMRGWKCTMSLRDQSPAETQSRAPGQLCEVSVSRGRNCNGDISAHCSTVCSKATRSRVGGPILEVSSHYVACAYTARVARTGQRSLSDDLASRRRTALKRTSLSSGRDRGSWVECAAQR